MSAQTMFHGASPPLRRIRWSLLLALLCTLTLGSVVLAQSGSTYDLRWNVLSGGGALSTGTNYQVNYSFGQPSTIGLSAGTNYQLGQGYWYGGAAPTAVKLLFFTAGRSGPAVLLTWATAEEHDNLGFNLYRRGTLDGPAIRLNAALIPTCCPGGGAGATYVFLDTTVEAGAVYFYTLEDVDLNGTRTLHGPIQATAPYAVFLPVVK
ncbi:MAG: hypothetical protein ACP5OO_07190 [Chloroflexia bacterium]